MIKEKVFSTKYSASEFIRDAQDKRMITAYSIGYTSDYDVVVTMVVTKRGEKEL